MTITVKHTGTANKTYKVEGETLADIWNDILKKGPVVNGKHVAAKTVCPVEMKASSVKMDHKIVASKKTKGHFDAELWHKKGAMTFKCTVLMPKLASDKALSPKAKKEWRRFLGKLAGHEKEHETLTGHEASHLAAEMDGLKFKGTGASEKKAFDAAVKTFRKEFTKNYGGTKIDDRLKEAHKSFDAKTGHGASQGAKLNTTIE